ncbi:hypothetical protein M434DRAFT_31900 [Hypoxylon sp. CO27-5]|nr:hypothetical protein M434DRAFT_31900 [Hypoxylon sp. CO27-5]
MSSASSYGHYATLEVENTATTQEIIASYRRLALIHHPDKNPDDQEAATEVFQKIQLAYETLKNPEKRFQYDARISFITSASSESQGQSTGDDGNLDEHNFPPGFGNVYFFMRREGGSPVFYYTTQPQPTHEHTESSWHESEESEEFEEFDQEEVLEQLRRRAAKAYQERVAREREEARIKKAEAAAAAKQASEEAKAQEKEAKRMAEKTKQEERWATMNAQTKEEKLETCLHSEFCAKTQLRQKFKCGACHVKRGITAFECPHCDIFICQQCVVDFGKKRVAAEQNPIQEPEPVVDPEPEVKVGGHDKKSTKTNSKGGRGRPHKANGQGRKRGKGKGQ